MNLYDRNYNELTSEECDLWDNLKKQERIGYKDKMSNFRISLYDKYPKAVRHFESLFPNNFVDAIDLRHAKEDLGNLLIEFEKLLNIRSTSEREILNFIRSQRAYFIIGSILQNYRFGHHALYVFPEFQLSTNYKADYLLVGENSYGHHFVFVELESSYGVITMQDGTYGKVIRNGITQIDKWELWVEQNFQNLRTTFDAARKPKTLLPNEFFLYDKSRIHFAVIAGRRADYKDLTYRLRETNIDQRKLLILHYDNVIEDAKAVINSQIY